MEAVPLGPQLCRLMQLCYCSLENEKLENAQGEGGFSPKSLSEEGSFAGGLWPPMMRGTQPRRTHACKAEKGSRTVNATLQHVTSP